MNSSLKYKMFSALCGIFLMSSIVLDQKIGNLDGKLSWGDKDFSMSCRQIIVEKNMLSALCIKMDGSSHYSTLDLNVHIANIDGTLTHE